MNNAAEPPTVLLPQITGCAGCGAPRINYVNGWGVGLCWDCADPPPPPVPWARRLALVWDALCGRIK